MITGYNYGINYIKMMNEFNILITDKFIFGPKFQDQINHIEASSLMRFPARREAFSKSANPLLIRGFLFFSCFSLEKNLRFS